MGTLRDEVFEKLDYLSQLTEVVISPQNEILATIPDRIELSFEDVERLTVSTWSTSRPYALSRTDILVGFLRNDQRHMVQDIKSNFSFEISPDFLLDFDSGTMKGAIALVKHSAVISERELLEMAAKKAVNHFARWCWEKKRLQERTITVMNTLEEGKGFEWARSRDSDASVAISRLLQNVILENKWRIRDTAVIEKMGEWIQSYMADAPDNVGLVNLIKLKMMVDKDVPVYSIDEVKNVNPA